MLVATRWSHHAGKRHTVSGAVQATAVRRSSDVNASLTYRTPMAARLSSA